MERDFDVTLNPTEGAMVLSLLQPQALRFYESSVEGLTTVVMADPVDKFISAGTRLTREQVAHLVDELSLYVHGETLAEAYERGRDNGYQEGERIAFDQGYELGYGRGRDEVDW